LGSLTAESIYQRDQKGYSHSIATFYINKIRHLLFILMITASLWKCAQTFIRARRLNNSSAHCVQLTADAKIHLLLKHPILFIYKKPYCNYGTRAGYIFIHVSIRTPTYNTHHPLLGASVLVDCFSTKGVEFWILA
jgi:hypothetical protein